MVLASDLFDTLVVRMPNYDQVTEYLAVSGTTSLRAQDRKYLDIVSAAVSDRYCRPGCDRCHAACPRVCGRRHPPLQDVFRDYGDQKFAMQRYGMVPASTRSAACTGCPAPCEPACPYGLRIRDRLAERIVSCDSHNDDTSRSTFGAPSVAQTLQHGIGAGRNTPGVFMGQSAGVEVLREHLL